MVVGSAASAAVIPAAEDDQKRDDDEPHALVVKDVAKAIVIHTRNLRRSFFEKQNRTATPSRTPSGGPLLSSDTILFRRKLFATHLQGKH